MKKPPWVQEVLGLPRIEQKLDWLLTKGNQIMAQLDDLKAALDAITASVDGVDTKLDGVRDGIAGVAAEVQVLIGLLGQPAVDLTAAIAQAQGIADRLAAVTAEVDTAKAALDAIPPAP